MRWDALRINLWHAAQTIANSPGTSLSYVRQHGDQKDLLLLRINETFGLVIAFHEMLGLSAILDNTSRSAAAFRQILGTGTNL